MVMAKANLIGNCRRLNTKGRSVVVGAMFMRGIKTIWFAAAPVKTQAIINFVFKVCIHKRVPLQRPRLVFKIFNSIMMIPTYKCIL